MVDRSKTFQIIANAVMILLVLFCLVPFALLIVSSITKETSLVKYGYSFIPREIDLAAYKAVSVFYQAGLLGKIPPISSGAMVSQRWSRSWAPFAT